MRFNLSDRYSLPSLKFLITILQIFMRIIRHFSRIATVLAKYPLKMQLDSPEFHALFTPELKKLSSIFTSNGFELRMAGGAVRDLLMGVRPSDVDFATDATPLQMKEIFTQEQIRMLNKNGEEHGTITCRIDDKENFEITTLRIDVVCDGRRAAVKFTKDWEEDAFRRDLTINSLFLDLDGFVHDYTGGIEDIKNRRISFVGDPVIRLQEDFLRILRYFRFFGRFAPVGATHEPKNIEAIIKCKDGLKNISGERLWMEFNKILIGRMASSVIKEMLLTCKLGPFLCLPENVGFDEFERVAKVNSPKGEDGPLAAAPSTLLSALFNKIEDVERFQSRCKCSNAEKWLCELIVQKREEAMKHKNDINYFKYAILDEIFERGGQLQKVVHQNYLELIKYIGIVDSQIFKEINEWNLDKFPISGIDLMSLNIPKGPKMKKVLKYLFNVWIKNNLKLNKEELLEHIKDNEVDNILAEIEEPTNKKKRRMPGPFSMEKR